MAKYSPFVGKEIKHLVEDKGYTQERAVGAAINIARRKGLKVPDKKGSEGKSSRRRAAARNMLARMRGKAGMSKGMKGGGY